MKKIVIVGGGAAGLMAAVSAAENGASVTILEKMPAIGRKLLITGKGRCNITNMASLPEFINHMPGNGAFLYSCFYAFSNQDMIDFLQQYGVPTKVERGGRVFPVSDKAVDVVNAFARALKTLQVQVLVNQTVNKITVRDGCATSVITEQNRVFAADAVILTTGGASYPGTGSSGDGYRLAVDIGHTIEAIRPSLVPLEVAEDWIGELQGLALKNVSAAVICQGKTMAEEFGEMLFTHYGLSGPIILSLSKVVAEQLTAKQEVVVAINLKPALSAEVLDKRLQRDFAKFSRKQMKNALHELLPASLIPVVIDLAYIQPEKYMNQITKADRERLLRQITHLTFTITRTRPVSEAIVTAGGVRVKEIIPSSMQSKLVRNVYFAGELLDIDGYTGGFNLQAAFSTGHAAGKHAAAD